MKYKVASLCLAALFTQSLGCVNKAAKPNTDPNKQKQTQLNAPDPTNADSLYAYASQLEQQGDEEKALGFYLQATQIQPEHLKSQIALAQLYIKFNRMEEAKVASENILRLDRQHPFVKKYKEARLKYYSALNIAQNEEYEKALELLSQAPRNTPLDKEIEETSQKWKQLVDSNKSKKLRNDIIQQASLLAYKGKHIEAIALIKTAPGAEGDSEVQTKVSQWQKARDNNGKVELSTAPSISGETRYISATKVHIRQSPYLYAQALSTLKQGVKVDLLMANAYRSDGYSWSKVRTKQGIVGWVASSLLSKTSEGQQKASPLPQHPSQTSSSKTYGKRYLTGDQVNVRRSPALSGTLITSLVKNSRVSLLTKHPTASGGYQWHKVRLPDNQVGWIATQFLSSSTQSTTTTVKSTPKANSTPKAAVKMFRYIKGQKINIRSAASTEGKILMQLSSPTQVQIMSKAIKKADYYWVKIKSGTKEGWMVANFLTKTKPQASIKKVSTIRYIRADQVNLRTKPTTGSSVVKRLDEGTRVTLLSTKAVAKGRYKWVKIRLKDGKTGWIATEFLGR